MSDLLSPTLSSKGGEGDPLAPRSGERARERGSIFYSFTRHPSVVLLVAAGLAAAHYTFGEWVRYPGVALWKERAFWAVIPTVVVVPVAHWLFWTLLSLRRLNPAPVILAAAAILCLGDLVWYLVWLNLKALRLDYKQFVGYWDWWEYWLPVVVVAANLFLASRWWQVFQKAEGRGQGAEVRGQKSEVRGQRSEVSQSFLTSAATLSREVLRGAALLLGGWAALVTAIHLVLPRMAVSDFTLSLADTFLVPAEWRAEFEFVVGNSVSRGKRLGALLDHASLSHLQRHHFYQAVDEPVYQQFVLSPVVDRLPLSELDWRRTLWESLFPRVRHEHDPALAAQTVVRYLRERVGIDRSYSYRVGPETIWELGMADEKGFECIYVAALRSVGIAARLGEGGQAVFWDGRAWLPAPRPLGGFSLGGPGAEAPVSRTPAGRASVTAIMISIVSSEHRFPLTPALSPRERENHLPGGDKSRRADLSSDRQRGTLSLWERAGVRAAPYPHSADASQRWLPLLLWRRGLGRGGPLLSSTVGTRVPFPGDAYLEDGAWQQRTTASSPWPSPPKEEREPFPQPLDAGLRVRCGVRGQFSHADHDP